jgi:hypothetical protein
MSVAEWFGLDPLGKKFATLSSTSPKSNVSESQPIVSERIENDGINIVENVTGNYSWYHPNHFGGADNTQAKELKWLLLVC